MVLQSFDSHRNLLQGVHNSQQHRALQDTRQRIVDVQRRTNDHIMRYQSDWQDIQNHINQYENDRVILLEQAAASEAQRKDLQYTEVLRWLRSPEFKNSEILRHAKLQRDQGVCPETGKWILREDKVAEWMAPDPPSHSMLWIHGKNGTGKTRKFSGRVFITERNGKESQHWHPVSFSAWKMSEQMQPQATSIAMKPTRI